MRVTLQCLTGHLDMSRIRRSLQPVDSCSDGVFLEALSTADGPKGSIHETIQFSFAGRGQGHGSEQDSETKGASETMGRGRSTPARHHRNDGSLPEVLREEVCPEHPRSRAI